MPYDLHRNFYVKLTKNRAAIDKCSSSNVVVSAKEQLQKRELKFLPVYFEGDNIDDGNGNGDGDNNTDSDDNDNGDGDNNTDSDDNDNMANLSQLILLNQTL